MTLNEIIKEHNIENYTIHQKENTVKELLKNIRKAKYVEQIDYWYDDEENPTLNTWCEEKGEGSRFNISNNKYLKEFIIADPPTFKISSKCCRYAKKNVVHKILREGVLMVMVKYHLNCRL